jgi:hypothetical protein
MALASARCRGALLNRCTMRLYALFTLSLLSLGAFAQDGPKAFVPWSALNPTEVANLKEKLKRTTHLSDAVIENMVKDEANYHTYRDSDIVAAFPELRGDRKLSECSNRMMGGAAELVFISDARKNEVTVKTVNCSSVKKGLSCEPVSRGHYYFLESPEHFFSLENLTFEKARTIIEAYKARPLAGLPDWAVAPYNDVRLIKALPDGHYRMFFGDFYCKGCTTRFDVQLDTSATEPRLILAGNVDGGCI